MTVKQDLDKAVAAAEAAQGSYLLFATATEDNAAQQMYQTMAADMTRHAQLIQGRVDYLTEANALNHPVQAVSYAAELPTVGYVVTALGPEAFGPRSKKKRHR